MTNMDGFDRAIAALSPRKVLTFRECDGWQKVGFILGSLLVYALLALCITFTVFKVVSRGS